MTDDLYDKNGNILCAPEGGFADIGDRKCPDFFEVSSNCKVVWKDESLFSSFSR
jgi:hypothetical protein